MKQNYKYAIACPTSMGLRITPQDRMAVHNSNLFYLQATSAESNVLNVSSSLGKECLVLTKFVEGSPMAAFIKAQLRARNIRYEGPPWGTSSPMAAPGGSGTSSTSPTPASASVPPGCGTTGPAKWDGPSALLTSTSTASSARRV